MMNSKLNQALRFASAAHEGQVRKYTHTPYIGHPVEVMHLLERFHPAASDDMKMAALLHDVVEDTDVTIDQVEAEFGPKVAALVADLTDVSKPSDGNRALRKSIDRAHTQRASAEAQVVKLADLISNTTSIVAHDRAFAKVYLREKAQLLSVMRAEVKATEMYDEAVRTLVHAALELGTHPGL